MKFKPLWFFSNHIKVDIMTDQTEIWTRAHRIAGQVLYQMSYMQVHVSATIQCWKILTITFLPSQVILTLKDHHPCAGNNLSVHCTKSNGILMGKITMDQTGIRILRPPESLVKCCTYCAVCHSAGDQTDTI